MIYVFTGNGKGKTTAAVGQGIRAVGQGKKVLMVQFVKSKNWPTGEERAIKKFGDRFKVITGGKGFVGIMGDKLPRSVHIKAARETLEKAKKFILSKRFGVIILDEVNIAISLKLVKLEGVLNILKLAPRETDVILTGRGAPKKLIEIADLVTEFKEVKHYFKKGVTAGRGREF